MYLCMYTRSVLNINDCYLLELLCGVGDIHGDAQIYVCICGVCVFLHVCIYICTHVFIKYVSMYQYIHTCTHIYILRCRCIHIHAYTCIALYIYVRCAVFFTILVLYNACANEYIQYIHVMNINKINVYICIYTCNILTCTSLGSA